MKQTWLQILWLFPRSRTDLTKLICIKRPRCMSHSDIIQTYFWILSFYHHFRRHCLTLRCSQFIKKIEKFLNLNPWTIFLTLIQIFEVFPDFDLCSSFWVKSPYLIIELMPSISIYSLLYTLNIEDQKKIFSGRFHRSRSPLKFSIIRSTISLFNSVDVNLYFENIIECINNRIDVRSSVGVEVLEQRVPPSIMIMVYL